MGSYVFPELRRNLPKSRNGHLHPCLQELDAFNFYTNQNRWGRGTTHKYFFKYKEKFDISCFHSLSLLKTFVQKRHYCKRSCIIPNTMKASLYVTVNQLIQ